MYETVLVSGLIAPSRIQKLLEIIHVAAVVGGRATCGAEFNKLFRTSGERFKARCWITHLLAESVLTVEERLVALFLLQYGYTCDARSLPFLHVFLKILRSAGEGIAEADFINQLIKLTAQDAQACTDCLNKAISQTRVLPDGTCSQGMDPPFLRCRKRDPHATFNLPVRMNQRQALPDAEGVKQPGTPIVWSDVFRIRDDQATVDTIVSRAPTFARPVPPLMEPLREETCPWLPPVTDSLLWDDASEVAPSQISAIQKLLAEAQCKPVQPMQHKELILALDSWPRIVHHIGFCPAQLPALVEHNNLIAVELLLKLISTNSPRVNAFLAELIHMDLSVHAMEVVKTLTSAATLPEDFIHRYIHACIAACEAIEQRSQKQQNRPVRLVCVFLQSLINTKIVDVKAIQFEVPPFCIKFSRIREAAVLYKMIHQ